MINGYVSEEQVGNRTVEVPLAEVLEVFQVLEDLNDLLHRAELTIEEVNNFRRQRGGYKRLSHVYYKVVDGWLPADIEEAINERPN